MDQSTARRMARQMNAADPTLAAAVVPADGFAGLDESVHDWVVRTLDGTAYRIYRNADDWAPPVYENPRYVPEKVEGYWRVRDTHNRMLMADAFYDVMAAEDACLSLNRPQVPPTEPSDSQLRLLCDISAQRADDPELRMRASEVRWLAREARRAAQTDEEIAELRAALLRRGPSPFQLLERVHQVLAELPKRAPGTKTPELADGLT